MPKGKIDDLEKREEANKRKKETREESATRAAIAREYCREFLPIIDKFVDTIYPLLAQLNDYFDTSTPSLVPVEIQRTKNLLWQFTQDIIDVAGGRVRENMERPIDVMVGVKSTLYNILHTEQRGFVGKKKQQATELLEITDKLIHKFRVGPDIMAFNVELAEVKDSALEKEEVKKKNASRRKREKSEPDEEIQGKDSDHLIALAANTARKDIGSRSALKPRSSPSAKQGDTKPGPRSR